MKPETAALWATQDRHQGDRQRLFRAVAATTRATTVLYPGSYVDVAPSFVFPSVTYLDMDRRTPAFFADASGLAELVADHDGPSDPRIDFIHADYTDLVDLPDQHVDLLVSLYAGLVSHHCTRYLRVGGTLLANASHGDVAMASIDPRYELAGVVTARAGQYRVDTADLDSHLVPTKPQAITVDSITASGRAIAYTRSAFAYLFTRTS